MADPKTQRLNPKVLQADRDTLAALKGIPDYKPANDTYSLANLLASESAMDEGQTKEIQDEATAKASRDDATALEWAFHDDMIEAKAQVKAQYGSDSNQVQAVGLKKKSEYKKPSKKPKS